jgi:hypothetical protein
MNPTASVAIQACRSPPFPVLYKPIHLLTRHLGILVRRWVHTCLPDTKVCWWAGSHTPPGKTLWCLASRCAPTCSQRKLNLCLESKCACSPRHLGVWQADVFAHQKTEVSSKQMCSPRHQGVPQAGVSANQDTEVSGKQVHTYLLARHRGVWKAGAHPPSPRHQCVWWGLCAPAHQEISVASR